jgi:hypothetical protein
MRFTLIGSYANIEVSLSALKEFGKENTDNQ